MAPSDDVISPLHLRMSWGGVLGNPAMEIWSNTVNWIAATQDPADNTLTIPTVGQLQAGVDGIAEALRGWFQSPQALISRSAALKYCKLNFINDHGLQPESNTVVHDFPETLGNYIDANNIWEQSYALTLRTALQRGRSHSGRIYPPISGGSIGVGQPYIDESQATGMATKFANFLTAATQGLNGAMLAAGYDPSGWRPAVVSPGSRSAGTPPLQQIITGVVCDRVADIQHRRTRNIPRREGTRVAV